MMMAKKFWVHLLAALSILLMSTGALADVPTAEQQGVFTGKGTLTVYFNNNPKPAKSKGTITIIVDPTGTYLIGLPPIPGLSGVAIMEGTGSYGTGHATLLCNMSGGSTTGYVTLAYKISGAKSRVSMLGGVSAAGVNFSCSFSGKKLVPGTL